MIANWAARGLISDAQAQALRAGLPPARSGPEFRGLMILLGCLCLCAALITPVAANWDDMAWLTRVGLRFAALWAAWDGAVWAGRRGTTWVFEGLTGLACIAYGPSIMVIAQIYHIQGNAADAVWLWAAGTFLAAGVMRAQVPLALALAPDGEKLLDTPLY